MEATFEKFKVWQRSSWPYWLYAKAMFAIQPYRDDTFEATQIIKNLWVGDIRSPCNKQSLIDNNIDTIISAVYGATAQHPFSFNYEKANLRDVSYENIIDEFDRLLPKIREKVENGNGVLVHCMQGASRSVTIVAAYLIKYHNMSGEDALVFMKNKRSCVNPNEGYRVQLEEYEERVKAENEKSNKEKKDR